MGQACVKDKQTSQRRFSFDSSMSKSDKHKHDKVRGHGHSDHHQPTNLFVSEQFTFDNEFDKRHEKLKGLGKHATPKHHNDSDLNMSF